MLMQQAFHAAHATDELWHQKSYEIPSAEIPSRLEEPVDEPTLPSISNGRVSEYSGGYAAPGPAVEHRGHRRRWHGVLFQQRLVHDAVHERQPVVVHRLDEREVVDQRGLESRR